MCDIIPQDTLVLLLYYALLRLDKKLFILPVYVLRTLTFYYFTTVV